MVLILNICMTEVPMIDDPTMILLRSENPEMILREANYILKLSVGLDNIGKSLTEICPICHENFTTTTFFSPSGAPESISQRNKLISCGCPGTGNQHIFHAECLTHIVQCPICMCNITKPCTISERTTRDECNNKIFKSTIIIHEKGKKILNDKLETHELLHNLETLSDQAQKIITQRQEEETISVPAAISRSRLFAQEMDAIKERDTVAKEVIDELERNAPTVRPVPSEERQQGVIGWMSNYLPGPLTRRRPATSGGKSNKRKPKTKNQKKNKN